MANKDLHQSLEFAIDFVLKEIRSPHHKLPNGVAIAPPLDGGNGFIGKSCAMKGVALYDHVSRKLYIDDELFSQMSLTDRVALVLHEASYKVFRDWYFAENSLGARKFVGCLMAKAGCKDLDVFPDFNNPDLKDAWHCISTKSYGNRSKVGFEFYIQVHGRGAANWFVTRIYGSPVATKTLVKSPLGMLSRDGNHPLMIEGKTYFRFIGNANFEWPLLLTSESGQSTSIRLNTIESPSGPQYQIDGLPIVCE